MKKIINFLFKRYTKWIPFANYNYGGSSYMIFVRKNLINGMLYFKTKNINPNGNIFTIEKDFHCERLLDESKQFVEILKLEA